MSSPDSLVLSSPLLRPPRGGSTRLRVGRFELVLEAVRGGHSLLWGDGQRARRYAVGLGDVEHLSLQLRPPAWPCRVVMRETLLLTPGARLRGFVQVPLVPAIVGHLANGQDLQLLELANADLDPEWDERFGTTFRVASSWHVRFPMPVGDARVTVPLSLRNDAAEMFSPPDLPVSLVRADLHELRSTIVAKPRRLRWNGQAWQGTAAPTRQVQR